MSETIQGIHHITTIAGAAQRNLDFYSRLLGQRLVKRTVNFDDPGTYHLYYGDAHGSPGTILTFFPWARSQPGQRGSGEVAALSYGVSEAALAAWQQRLETHGVDLQQGVRFGAPMLRFTDPDGMAIELIAGEELPEVAHWSGGPLTAEMALRGFHGATLQVREPEPTAALLTGLFGYQPAGEEAGRFRFASNSGAIGETIDLLARPDLPPARLGRGSVHHIAFRTPSDAAQQGWLTRLRAAGYQVTPVQDRQYFHSIYFREPQGVLFEIATDPPGFLLDEPAATLGSTLRLPPWLETRRAEIEERLPPLERPEVTP